MIVRWSDDMSINIPEVDAQHKRLLDMINELHEAMKVGRGRSKLDEIIARMFEYAKVHFSTEERYMEKFGYPGYAAHRREHADFVDRVSDFYERFKSGEVSAVEVMNFLKDWLVNHILGSDKRFGEYLSKKIG